MTNEGSQFIRQIAEAYRALEAEQGHLDRIDELSSHNAKLSETVAAREIHILGLKQEIDGLQAKVRSAEVERDDAGFRELEALDKANALALALRSVQATVGDALRAVEPEPKVESPLAKWSSSAPSGSFSAQPVDLPYTGSPEPTQESGERAVDPIANTEDTKSTNASSETVVTQENVSIEQSSAEGQRDLPPTASMTLTASPNAASDTVSSSESASSQGSVETPEEPKGPYYGKRYADHPYFVSEEGWVRGGGTLEDYHWKAPPVSAASHYS